MHQYKREFPSYDNGQRFERLLARLAMSGFCDGSWHNDICPNIQRWMPDGSLVCLYVDYADKQKRDFSDDSECLSVRRHSAGGECLYVYEGEDDNEAVRLCIAECLKGEMA